MMLKLMGKKIYTRTILGPKIVFIQSYVFDLETVSYWIHTNKFS